ncbi:MAG: death-on-curing protein [Treponema sp. CETP13]|nr:MAG: death-on-curing protein [Treponema sp. CETP13]
MGEFNYLTIEEALEIHRLTIKNSGGGNYGIIDSGRLESVLQHIQNDIYYPTFVDKITHLFFCACEFHCFCDGNKRIAITLSAQFLLKNGYMAAAKTFFVTMENISYHVAAGAISKDLLHKIMLAILEDTYETDEILKLEIYKNINKEKM